MVRATASEQDGDSSFRESKEMRVWHFVPSNSWGTKLKDKDKKDKQKDNHEKDKSKKDKKKKDTEKKDKEKKDKGAALFYAPSLLYAENEDDSGDLTYVL